MPNKWPFVAAGLISLVCLVFVYKEHFWAPCILIALKLGDMILTYMETSDIPGSFGSFALLFYFSAAQAIFFLNKQKNNAVDNNEDNCVTQES